MIFSILLTPYFSTSSSGVSSQSAVVRSSDQVSGDNTGQVLGDHGHQTAPVSSVSAAINIDSNAAATSSVMDNSAGSEIVPHLEQIDVRS